MSAEMITTIVGVVSLLLAFAGSFGWMIHRTDAQFADVRREMRDGFADVRREMRDGFAGAHDEMRDETAGVRGELRDEIAGVRGEIAGVRGEFAGVRGEIAETRRELGARMDKMNDELVELKIAVARVEGPPRHLITGR